MRLMSWPNGECYLFSQQSLVVTLLLSLVSALLFSRTRGVLSHLNSSTHRFPRFPLRDLCFYVMLVVFSLAFAATTQPSYKLLFLQDWQNQKSFLQRLQTPVPGHLSFHSALSSYVLLASLALWQFLVSLRPLSQALGRFLTGPWSMVFRHQPIPQKGSGNNNNNSKAKIADALLRDKGS